MTPLELQKQLKNAIKECVQDLRFKNYKNEWVELNVFDQGVPIKQDDDEAEPYPYIETRIVEGISNNDTDDIIHTWIIIGIYNGDLYNNGSSDVLGVMERIKQRFLKKNTLDNFRQVGKIKWALQNTDTYPYYFGGMEMDFVGTEMAHENPEEAIYT